MGNSNPRVFNPLISKFAFFKDSDYFKIKSHQNYKFIEDQKSTDRLVLAILEDKMYNQLFFAHLKIDYRKILLLNREKYQKGKKLTGDIMNILSYHGHNAQNKDILIIDTYYSDNILYAFHTVGWSGLFIFINPDFNLRDLDHVMNDKEFFLSGKNNGKILTDEDLYEMRNRNIIIYYTKELDYVKKLRETFHSESKFFKIVQVESYELDYKIKKDIKNFVENS